MTLEFAWTTEVFLLSFLSAAYAVHRVRVDSKLIDIFSSRAAALVSRVSRLRGSRARALLSLNLKKKRDCSQSICESGLNVSVCFLGTGMAQQEKYIERKSLCSF